MSVLCAGVFDRTPSLSPLEDTGSEIPPQDKLTEALFTVPFSNFDKNGLSTTYTRWGAVLPRITPLSLVYWRDPVDNTWKGPVPLSAMR